MALEELNAIQEYRGQIEMDRRLLRQDLLEGRVPGLSQHLPDIGLGPVSGSRTQPLPIMNPNNPMKYVSVSQDEIEDMLLEDSERILATLKNLRRDGYCVERNMKELTKRAKDLIGPGSIWLIKQEAEAFDVRGDDKLRESYEKNRDEIWLSAIRDIVITYCPNKVVAARDWTYTSCVEAQKKELYLAAINAIARFAWIYYQKKESEQKQQWRTKYESKRDELQAFRRENALQQRQIEISVAKKYEASHAALMRDNELLSKRIAALENQLAKLSQNKTAEPVDMGMAVLADVTPVEKAPDIPEIEIPAFPEKGVVFIGGHPNMLKKLRQRHLNWSFVTSEDERKKNSFNSSLARISVAILWTDHLSHKLYESMMHCIPDGTPIIYASSTNLDAIDEEIREQWRDACIKAMTAVKPA